MSEIPDTMPDNLPEEETFEVTFEKHIAADPMPRVKDRYKILDMTADELIGLVERIENELEASHFTARTFCQHLGNAMQAFREHPDIVERFADEPGFKSGFGHGMLVLRGVLERVMYPGFGLSIQKAKDREAYLDGLGILRDFPDPDLD